MAQELYHRARDALDALREPERELREWVIANPPWSERGVAAELQEAGWPVEEGRMREAFRRPGNMRRTWVEWLEACAAEARRITEQDPMPPEMRAWLKRRENDTFPAPPPPPLRASARPPPRLRRDRRLRNLRRWRDRR